jgi:hypothetical protein
MTATIKAAIFPFAQAKTEPNANAICFLDTEAWPTAQGEYWIYASS